MKLSRLLGKHGSIGRTRATREVTAKRVKLNGLPISDPSIEVTRFDHVEWAGQLVQEGCRALFIMLNKPEGFLCATKDRVLPTVLDLIDDPDKGELHLAGRLDRSSTGLVLLTNDGSWSKKITDPAFKLSKVYRVETHEPINDAAAAAFAAGFYFHTEDLTTRPAKLEILTPTVARVTLWEGRYHQIKRMFHRVGNRVQHLHREAIGSLILPDDLPPGRWRFLNEDDKQLLVRGCKL